MMPRKYDKFMNDKKTIWVIANWKSNKTIEEALAWLAEVGPKLPRKDYLKVAVCPTFIALEEMKKAIQVGNFPILLGAQDLSPFPEGAYTGEEPAAELRGLIDLSILGHSERRRYFEETDEMIAKKVVQANKVDITPLVCVQGEETPVPENCNLIAFEPIEAIGSGHPDTPEDASRVAQTFKDKYGQDLAVLYGGSVTSINVREFVRQDTISGVLIGGASLKSDEFVKIVENCSLV